MLMIRLQRVGRKHDPSFRVVLTDSKNGPKSGKFNEILGFHNPRTKETKLEAEKIKARIASGAQLSDTLHNLLITQKIIEGKKINVLPKKKPIVSEKEGGDEAPAAPTTEPAATEGEAGGAPVEEKKEESAPEETKKEETTEAPVAEEETKKEE